MKNVSELTRVELMAQLITADYNGKVFKQKCLDQLIQSAFKSGYAEGVADTNKTERDGVLK